MHTPITTDQPITTDPPTSTPDPAVELASLRIQLQAAHERIAELVDRSGPEHLVHGDLELASWLASAASAHPKIGDPTAPMAWPAAARAQLEELISRYRCMDTTPVPTDDMSRAEQLLLEAGRLRTAAQIHELCEANDCGVESSAAEIADAIVLDDDREWRRRYIPGAVH